MTQFPYQNWMGDIAGSIGRKRLNEICIPATHNSGAYGLHATVEATAYFGQPWANNQSLPIYHQLMSGIRVLDLRLMYVGDPEKPAPRLGDVRITHSYTDEYPHIATYIGRPIEDELNAVAEFLRDHPKEIVIIWINRCRRFNLEVHWLVAECLFRHFFPCHIPYHARSWSLETLLGSGHRVIVRYSGQPQQVNAKHFWMWGRPEESWAHNHIGDLSMEALFKSTDAFLAQQARERSKGNLYYAELQLTESESDIIKDVASQPLTVAMMGLIPAGLLGGPGGAILGSALGAIIGALAHTTQVTSTLQMAVVSNLFSYNWLRLAWAESANIVAVDYFEQGGQLLEIVKTINENRPAAPVGPR